MIEGIDKAGAAPTGAGFGPATGATAPRSARLRRVAMLGLAASMTVLSACNEPEVILTGEREDVRPLGEDTVAMAARGPDRSLPISLPAPQVNGEWLQGQGTPGTRVAHPALSAAPQPIWATSIGAGDSRRNRLTAAPVVAGGRIFTLDSEAKVTAVSPAGGALWQTDVRPVTDNTRDATGGGLAFGGGRLYVTTGFGRLSALDPATGGVLWHQELGQVGNGAPTYSNGVVYLTAGDATGWAIEADTGRVRWQLNSAAEPNNVLGGPSPAVTDNHAIFAFGSGEVQGAFRNGGLRLWNTIVAGRRLGYARANVGDITGDPVVAGDTVYVGSHSGRMVALNVASGERIWTADEGPMSPVRVAGGAVFLVSDRNELVRLDAATGERVWGTELPFFTRDRPRRQKEVFAHYGPILAGGRLVVASNDGLIRFFDPTSGALVGRIEIDGGASTDPVVAGGVLYVVSTRGVLHAFR